MLSPARDLVTDRVARRAGQFPHLDIHALDTGNLSARDAALAVAIDRAVARRWLTLVAVVQSCLTRPWEQVEPRVQGPLLVGAAQLLLLERQPDHAVINEAVQWTSQQRNRRAAGLVNAVLRRVAALRQSMMPAHDPQRRDEVPLADGRAWRLQQAVFAEDDLARLGETTSHGSPLMWRWLDRFGGPETRQMAFHDLVHPPVILSGVDSGEAQVIAHGEEGFVIYDGPVGGLDDLLQRHPAARVQDPTAAAPVRATASIRPRTIIDVCAGLGTKTRQLARLHPEATIIASDADTRRLERLDAQFRQPGQVTVVPPRQLGAYAGTADLLLLDVPCSNTGVLARRPEAKYRFDRASLESLVDAQRQIVADSLALLAPGGTLVYATCSIDEDENQRQAQWIARWHPLRIVSAWSRPPSGHPGGPPAGYTDGGYFAILRASRGAGEAAPGRGP